MLFKISSLVGPIHCALRCTMATDSQRSRGGECEGDNSLSPAVEVKTDAAVIHPHIVHRNDCYIHQKETRIM